MNYKLIVTYNTHRQIDNAINYLLYELKSKQAAKHLIQELKQIYESLQINPYQFSFCNDTYLRSKEYRIAHFYSMRYLLIFKVVKNEISILGFFHSLENYSDKL